MKIPLCLGALISEKHVLSTKSCFGKSLQTPGTKVQATKVKALVGLDRSFPLSTVTEKRPDSHHACPAGVPSCQAVVLRITEHEYLNIERIKTDENDENNDFCIVTLKESVANTSPFCLPKEPSDLYAKSSGYHEGKIYGFGYKKEFQNEAKSVDEFYKMKQRDIEFKKESVYSVNQCLETWTSTELRGVLQGYVPSKPYFPYTIILHVRRICLACS